MNKKITHNAKWPNEIRINKCSDGDAYYFIKATGITFVSRESFRRPFNEIPLFTICQPYCLFINTTISSLATIGFWGDAQTRLKFERVWYNLHIMYNYNNIILLWGYRLGVVVRRKFRSETHEKPGCVLSLPNDIVICSCIISVFFGPKVLRRQLCRVNYIIV